MPAIIEASAADLRRLLELRERAKARAGEQARNIDVFGLLEYEPTPKQRQFHEATEWDVFYGGAAGGGKTKALVMEALRVCVRYPGIRVGIFRRSYPELEESVIAELAAVGFAQVQLDAHWDASKHDLRFDNGSLLMCRYARTVEDFTRRQGGQYQYILVDERTLMNPDVVTLLESRLRSGDPKVPVLGVRSAGNPGGAGHGAMKSRYVDATDHGARTYTDKRGRVVRFIPARTDDNPHLNPEYAQDLEALPTAMRKAFKDGDWDSFLGQFFDQWRYDRHVVPRPREGLPKAWHRWCGIDYGRRAPWAVLWIALDGDGRVWLYRELYKTNVGVRDQARAILAMEADAAEVQVRHVIDPATANHLTDGLSILEEYAQEGLGCLKADNDRVAGWTKVHDALSEGPLCPLHAHLKEQGKWADDTCPLLHVLEGTCPNLVRTLPSLPFDPAKVEDVDTDAEDHAPDALRYALQMMGSAAAPVFHEDTDRPVPKLKRRKANDPLLPGPGTALSPFAKVA